MWWIFAINFLLALVSTRPLSDRVGRVLDHSVAAERLANGFDVGSFSELVTTPDVAFFSRWLESAAAVLVFFVLMLFLTGGILASYANDYKLTTRDFFAHCGAFFWRWVRLCLFMLVILTPVGFASSALFRWSGKLMYDAAAEKTGYWVGLLVALLTLFVLMTVRLWFDMAQVRALVEDERAMRRSFVRGFRLTFFNFGSLFWLYFRISVLASLVLAIGLWLCIRLSGGAAILVLEIVLLWWVATRLWQRASEVVWYERRLISAAPVPLPVTPVPEPGSIPPMPLPSTE